MKMFFESFRDLFKDLFKWSLEGDEARKDFLALIIALMGAVAVILVFELLEI